MREILNDVEELRRLGDHLMAIGAYTQAARAYYRAIGRGDELLGQIGPLAGPHLHARMASALISDDLFLEASPYASEAFTSAERDPYVRYVHACMLNAEGSVGEAMDTLDDLAVEVQLQPWVNIARAEFDPNSVDIPVLRGILSGAVSKEPLIGVLRARLSDVSETAGDLVSSLEHARVAAWLQPSLLRRWRRYGTIAMLANSYAEAAEALESAREISPFDPRLDALIARAHLIGGDIDQAAIGVLRGLRKNNTQRDCLTILELLKKGNPGGMAASLLILESDQDVVTDKDPFIYVPNWPYQ